MIICIAGLSGSGKDTTGTMLAKELNLKHINLTYKSFAADREQLMTLLKKAKPSFHKDFDKEVIKQVKMAKDCVVTTWLGPWMIKNSTLNVWLHASDKERAKRIAKQSKITFKEALKYVKEKDTKTMAYMKSVYNIDLLNDHEVFDIEINTEKMTREQMSALIIYASMKKDKRSF